MQYWKSQDNMKVTKDILQIMIIISSGLNSHICQKQLKHNNESNLSGEHQNHQASEKPWICAADTWRQVSDLDQKMKDGQQTDA